MAKTNKKASAKKASATAKIEKAKPTVADLQAPAVDAADGSTLTLSDLQTIAQVIDAATRRGAFGAAEVSEVGAIYTKLTTFLNVVAAQQREAGDAGDAGKGASE